MKKALSILCLSFLTTTVFGQALFSVPAPADLQKYKVAALHWNGAYLIQISYARSQGKPVEDVARFVGDQLLVEWKKENGYTGFVQGILYFMVSLVSNGSVAITEQTDNEIVYRVSGLYSDLREGGSVFDVTYNEYIKFLEIAFSRIADHMGAKYSQKDTDEGLIVTIRKK